MEKLIVTKKTDQVCTVCRVGRSHFVKEACIDKEYCLDNSGSQERCGIGTILMVWVLKKKQQQQ